MIIVLWHRWTQSGHSRWLALCLALLVADLLVGSALIAWEIRMVRGAWGS